MEETFVYIPVVKYVKVVEVERMQWTKAVNEI